MLIRARFASTSASSAASSALSRGVGVLVLNGLPQPGHQVVHGAHRGSPPGHWWVGTVAQRGTGRRSTA